MEFRFSRSVCEIPRIAHGSLVLGMVVEEQEARAMTLNPAFETAYFAIHADKLQKTALRIH